MDSFVRDKNVLISDAVLASCSAPTYFPPVYVDPYLLADGGLWSNNPSLVAYVEATTVLGAKPEGIALLSIGTGIGEKYYRVKNKDGYWGLINGWGGSGLIDLMMNLQSKNTHNMIKLLIPSSRYLRVDFSRDHKLSLDDTASLGDLKSIAEREFSEHCKEMRALLDLPQST